MEKKNFSPHQRVLDIGCGTGLGKNHNAEFAGNQSVSVYFFCKQF